MNRAQIKENISVLLPNFSDKESIFQLLLAYGIPKSRVERLKNNKLNLSKRNDQIILRNKIFCQLVSREKLNSIFITLKNSSSTYKYNPRFIIVTDFRRIIAEDTVQHSVLDIELGDLIKNFDFFLPLCPGRNNFKSIEKDTDKINLKAANKILKIYQHIVNENGFEINKVGLNVNRFFSRLLYCFFAEDTGLFTPKNIFTNSIGKYTKENGEDLDVFFKELFEVLNTPKSERKKYNDYRDLFEYVNGGLFEVPHETIKFSKKIRESIIDAGGLEWSDIYPDIFGSMIQDIGRPDQSMHFTSRDNILKLIKPLFLDELYEEFESINEAGRLESFLNRLQNIVVFDPACGSGNFLIVSYRNLRKLEMEILKRLNQMENYKVEPVSRVTLSQFYGIELEQFACEVAKSSLWIAEHQMNLRFEKEFGKKIKTLPLKDSGNIFWENAIKKEWDLICPKDNEKEIYVVGNPPYLGSRNQKEIHKNDMKSAFKKNYKNLDYISCWFLKAAEYMKNSRVQVAFVSTNSICQGVQVGLLWPLILKDNIKIKFAYQSFKWTSPVKNKAGVTCIIVGLSNDNYSKKTIYKLDKTQMVDNINPYLTPGNIVYVQRRSKPLSKSLPDMLYGSLLNDAGNLVLTEHEKNELLSIDPKLDIFVKNYVGSREFIKGTKRYCLYIPDAYLSLAKQNNAIRLRLEKVRKHRMKSSEKSTRALAELSHRYYFDSYKQTNALIIPRTSSEKRNYIPIGLLDSNYIISDAAQVIYNPEIWVFGILSSRMHMVWVRAIAGRLKTDYRYSSALCYNTFPLPELSENQKKAIKNHVFCIIEEREKHPEMTMADLYDPETMPKGLLDAHHDLDQAIEICYRSQPFIRDEERLEYLFQLYEELIIDEKMRSENA